MMPLDPPLSAEQEDETLATLCEAPEWEAYHIAWRTACKKYRDEKGDPWKIVPTAFATDPADRERIAKAQRNFYKSRASGGPLQRIRRMSGLLCCPMCGSQHSGTLDHYLPRKEFPEFSILPCNLIPACPHCNSGVKRERYRGYTSPERFIHPYFETIAVGPIWYVEVQPPFEMVTFRPRVTNNVSPDDQPMVQFHLCNVLGEVFHAFVGNQWSQLPTLIHRWAAPSGQIIPESVKTQLEINLRDTAITSGVNGWRTALLRGVLASQDAIAFLAGRAEGATMAGQG